MSSRAVLELAKKINHDIKPFPDEEKLQQLLIAKNDHEKAQTNIILNRARTLCGHLTPDQHARDYVDQVDKHCIESGYGRHVQYKLPATETLNSKNSPGWWLLPASIAVPTPTKEQDIALSLLDATHHGNFQFHVLNRDEHIHKPSNYLPMGH
jgi:hypothetical protein